MNPTIAEQIGAVRRRLEQTVLPALRPDADLAREQGEFILAALDLIATAHEHEYRYEVIELHDARATVEDLVACVTDEQARLRLLAECEAPPGPLPRVDECATSLADVRAAGRTFKRQVARLFEMLHNAGPVPRDAAIAVMSRLAERQVERERALYARTGYTTSERSLGEVLSDRG